MLELIIGRSGAGKTEACLAAMRERMAREPLGKALILLVPEHMTYKMERELAAAIPQGRGFLRGYVFGFRRFARQVLMETGGAAAPRMSEVGRRMLLKKILARRQGELEIFQRAARQRGFGKVLSEELKELKSYNLTPEVLRDAAENLPDARLRGKLADLSLLAGDFAAVMQGRYNDAEDMMAALAAQIGASAMVRGAEVWVDGFVFFNPQERQVLAALLRHAAHVHVTLAMDEGGDVPENVRQTGIFHRPWETMQRLRSLAADAGVPVRVRSLARRPRFRQASLAAIERGLFRLPAPAPDSAAGQGVHVVEAANRRIEVEAAAADIQRLCREEGYRYREVGILVREEDAYGGILKLVLEDYGIPFFRDSKRSAAHHPLAELVRSAFEVLHGWRYEPLFRCLRTGFFPAVREQIDLLENYVLEFGIRGARRWLMEEDWHWRRRSIEEEDGEPAARDGERLAAVNFIRREVVRPLAQFGERANAARTVEELTRAVYAFLEDLQATQRLEEWSQQAEAVGRLDAAAEHQQIWQDVMELLDQMVQASGAEEIEPGEYEAILGDGLEALEISLIPPGLDYVTVAAFDQNSLENARAVYILGANEGAMPRRSREKGLLTDADRLRLAEAGLELPGGGQETSFSERFLLYRGFTEAREYLWVSYSLADGKGDGLNPSTLIGQLRSLLPGAEFLSIPLESLEEGAEGETLGRLASLRLGAGTRAVSRLASALRAYRERGQMPAWWQDVYNWALEQPPLAEKRTLSLAGLFARAGEDMLPRELAARLFLQKKRLRGSVTRFERFHSCPFQHFAQYGLRLRERQEYRFRALDLGNLLHGVLRSFGERLKAEGRRWREVDAAECHAMCEEILARLAPQLQNEILLSTAQYQHQLTRIRAIAEHSIQRLIAFDAVSRFRPEAFERSFGRGQGSLPPLAYALGQGARLEISGQIDRMDFDEGGRYFLIMDYKTGQGYINLLEVYYGLRLQLLTYLLVARNLLARTEREEMLPAGMLYCFLKYPMVSSRTKITPAAAKEKIARDLKMPGWILADADVIRAIDGTQKFIRVRLTGKGIHAGDRTKVKTVEEFGILLDYMDYLLADTGRRILDGEAAARPYRLQEKNACAYCLYQAICGFDLRVEGFVYRDLAPHEDAEVMDAMELAGRKEARKEAGKKGGSADGMD